jgi:hypothetical protein
MPTPGRNRSSVRRAVIILAALLAPRALPAQGAATAPPPSAVRHDGSAADRAAIVAEVRAFYADVEARRWANVLDHFLPAKVTARWAPPVGTEAWRSLVPSSPPRDTTRLGSGGEPGCVGGGAERTLRVAVVGEWARVIADDCAGGVHGPTRGGRARAGDELWLLRVSGRWKIVHLESGAAGSPE